MSEKHTPGPWTAYCRDVDHKEGEPWSEDKFLQWEVSGPRVPDGRGEYYESDARLIAAAPDLLAALRSVHRWMDDQADAQSKGGHATFDLMMLREQRDIARAAIAKATGENT